MKFKLHQFILAMLIGFSAHAQGPFFQQYFLSKKTDPVAVTKIMQTKPGYLWLTTNKGLYRFDGKRYRVFTASDSLPDLQVSAIVQDSAGRIWTGHQSGKIAYYEGGKFHRFEPEEGNSPEPISDMAFDKQGNLWFSTLNDGLYYYKRGRLYRLDEAEGMPDLFVYDIEVGPDGTVYAGTDGGLVMCTVKGDAKPTMKVLNQKNGLADNIVRKILVDTKGNLVIGTEDSGVVYYDVHTNKFETLNADLRSVSDMVLKGRQIWVASAEAGMTVIDLATKQAKSFSSYEELTIPSISALAVDHEGNIWGGSRTGVFRTPGDEIEFFPQLGESNNVMAVAVDAADNIWFSTPTGLYGREHLGGNYRIIDKLSKTSFRDARVISLYTDPSGFVWAGLYGQGVLRFDPKTGAIKQIFKELRNGNVLNISGDGNTVWLATLGGAEKIDYDHNSIRVTHVSTESGLSSDFIYQVFVDSKERIWFGTDGKGIDMMEGNSIKHFDKNLGSKVVYGFAEDKQGVIWANVQDEGIFKFANDSFIRASGDSVRFHDSNNFALTTDGDGNIIAFSSMGVDIFDPTQKRLRHVGEEAGMEGHIANLNAVSRNGRGDLYFGTSHGIVVFNSGQLQMVRPDVIIESLTIGNKRIRITDNIKLAYDQNNITVNLLGFWFQNPDDLTFRYKMDNYDQSWITTGDNSITYSQLPPGEYTLRVRGSSAAIDGFTNESSVTFTISPPFWKTTLFYIAVLGLVAVSTYIFIKYRERALIEEKQLLEEKVAERTMEIQRKTEEIQAQNEEITAQAEEIRGINENLEMLVRQRTAELEKKNLALEEYAFINAHKLRSPVASILGLVNLLNKEQMNDQCKVINQHLKVSASELNDIVRSITEAIERGER